MNMGGASAAKVKPEAVSKPRLSDYVSLWLTVLSKARRKHLQSTDSIDLESFYEDFFFSKDMEGGFKDERRNVRRKTIVGYVQNHVTNGASILDVGCGFGELLCGMPYGFRLFGMDYSQSNVKAASRLLRGRAIIKQGNIYEIPFETASQDVCICLEVLEHIEHDVIGIREIVRVLKPGGILISSVPYTYYWPQYKKLIGHFRHYNRKSFTNLLTNNGLVAKDYLPNYPHWHLAYARRYTWVRFLSLTFGRLIRRQDVFGFKWPWSKETLMSKYAKKLEPLLFQDARIDYAKANSSTFIAATKP